MSSATAGPSNEAQQQHQPSEVGPAATSPSLPSGSSSSPESRPKPRPFHTDVRRTRGLQAGQILLQRRQNASSTYGDLPDAASVAAARAAELREEEVRLNKRIDEHVRSLESGLAELIQMFRVGDKSIARAEQEAFTSEFRADQIVRATSGLAGLGRALQLSLLLSQDHDRAAREKQEATKLKEEIEDLKQQSGKLLGEIFGVGDGENDLKPPELAPISVSGASKSLDSMLAAAVAEAAQQPASAEAQPGMSLTNAAEALSDPGFTIMPPDQAPSEPGNAPSGLSVQPDTIDLTEPEDSGGPALATSEGDNGSTTAPPAQVSDGPTSGQVTAPSAAAAEDDDDEDMEEVV